MTLALEFPGDDHELLRRIQSESLESLPHTLYRIVTEQYRDASDLLGIETELGRRIKTLPGYPLQPLIKACIAIAAHYRFHHPELSQLTMLGNGHSHEEQLRRLWRDHFEAEVRKLAMHRLFALPLLQTAAHWDSPRGRLACDEFRYAIDQEYGFLEQIARRDIQRSLNKLPEEVSKLCGD